MRVILAGLALSCLAAPAYARPFRIDDMLSLESYGQLLTSPDGRTVIVERRGAYRGGARFTYGFLTQRITSRIMKLDLAKPGRLVPAFAQGRDAGYWAGAFSPSGRKLTVFRLQRDRLRVGVLDLRSSKVRWLPGAPDTPTAAPAPVWLDDDRIAYLRFPTERLPFSLDVGAVFQRRMMARWRTQAPGKVASADLATTLFAGAVPGESRQLVIADVAAGTERVVASGEIIQFVVSPERTRIATIELGHAYAPDPGESITQPFATRRHRLRIVDLRSGSVVSPCPRCDLTRTSARFAADGRLAYVARLDGEGWAKATLRVWPAGVGAPIVLPFRPIGIEWLGDTLLAQIAGGSWVSGAARDGGPFRKVGVYRLVAADGRVAWLSNADGLWRIGSDAALVRVAAAADARWDLDFGDPAAVGSDRLSRADRPILRLAGSSGETVRFGYETSLPLSITVPSHASVLAISVRLAEEVALVVDGNGVGRLTVFRADATSRVVDTISAFLSDVDRPRMVPVARNLGIGPVVDWLILPPGSGPFPTIVIPYQGQTFGEDAPGEYAPGVLRPATSVQLLVANGYAVLLPSLPVGPLGRPQDTLVGDLDAAVDAAVATRLVDPARLGIFGHSNGGINALTIAARSSRYRAIVSASGASDMVGLYGSVPPAQRVTFVGGPALDGATGWLETGQGRMAVPPWMDPARYARASSFLEADRMKTPLLLITGDLDYVSMDQAERLFVALSRLGRDATLLRFYGEGHVLWSPANISLEWRTVIDFFHRRIPTNGVARDVQDRDQ